MHYKSRKLYMIYVCSSEIVDMRVVRVLYARNELLRFQFVLKFRISADV